MFFVILEGLETDSAKSSLGLLGDLIEGHVFFLNPIREIQKVHYIIFEFFDFFRGEKTPGKISKPPGKISNPPGIFFKCFVTFFMIV